ncbi:endonuclease MutS2 [Leptolyngbya sp. 'hensonii']|nr:endonuclease MutS2 [Leptolyngbya sp. 'hensonii']
MIQVETLELLEWPRLCQHLSTFAATKLGAIAAQHLKLPETQEESSILLAQTQEVYRLESRLSAGLNFDGITDIGAALERADRGGILAGTDLFAIATTLAGARTLRRMIDDQPDLPVLTVLVADLRTYPELEQEIHRCIDEQGRVMDRASPKLAGIRERQGQFRDQLHQTLQRILQSKSNAVQEQLITQRADRFVIPVKASHKDAIPGIVHDSSTSGLTLYVEPQSTVPLNNQLRQLARQEQVEEEAVRQALTEQVAAVLPDLERLLAIVTTLDLATARARYALWMEANPPRFIEWGGSDPIVLRQLHHPLLVWQHQHEQGRPVVPIDLVIRPQIRVVAITGPNTGGKTVTLKTLGLAMVMARAGLFVPAREPVELPWFSQVLADIGDEQSIEQNLSTFSGHIRRISRILAAMDDRSLVLLDEVGAGTDPSEGSALAIALLQALAEQAQLTVATTHFGELKALKYQDERFENASVEFDDVTLSPTYRLLWGIPGRSNALTIARRLGLSGDIVAQAETLVGGTSEDVNQMIAGLEAQRRLQEARAEEARQLLHQAERLHQEVATKAAALKERERTLQLAQEEAMRQALAQAKGEIAQVIRQLQQGPATAQDAHQATAALNQIGERHLPSRQVKPQPKSGFQPQVGDRVRIPRLGQTAEVIGGPGEDGDLTVRFGLMKMTIALEDVESLDGQKPTPIAKPKAASPPAEPVTGLAIRTAQNTFDLRGMRVADAEMILDQAIAEARGPIWVIHGHGTGRLRQGVHTFLQQHPQVSRFEPAESVDGGTGVTVVYRDL